MRVFLTGGTGFIGRRLTERLLARGWQVTALVRRPDSPEAQELAALGAALARGDVTERESLRAPMQGADIVVHNAGIYDLAPDRAGQARMRAVNVDGTANTLGLAAELGVPRIVHVSSVVAFGPTGPELRDETYQRAVPPSSLYEATKTEAHAIAAGLQRRGAPVIIVCPSQVIGPGDHSDWGFFQRLHVRGLMLPAGWAAEAIHTMTHVDDVAEGIALAAERGRPGGCYILAGEALRVREVMGIWASHPGGLRVQIWLPQWLAMAVATMAEPILRLLGLPVFLSREAVRGLASHLHYSGARAREELGATFRGQSQMWAETLAAERERLRRKA